MGGMIPDSRVLAIGIGLAGVLLVGLIVAVGVRALERASSRHRNGSSGR